jgi:hypothetical protein
MKKSLLVGLIGCFFVVGLAGCNVQKESNDVSTDQTQEAEWKTFTNSEGGYSFEYSPTWNAVEDKYNATYTLFGPEARNESGLGGVEFEEYTDTLESYLTYREDTVDIKYGAVENITVNGIPAIRAEYAGSATKGHSVMVQNEGKVFNIYLNSQFPPYVELFDKTVASFKFTE